jgi:hypothetical protein
LGAAKYLSLGAPQSSLTEVFIFIKIFCGFWLGKWAEKERWILTSYMFGKLGLALISLLLGLFEFLKDYALW